MGYFFVVIFFRFICEWGEILNPSGRLGIMESCCGWPGNITRSTLCFEILISLFVVYHGFFRDFEILIGFFAVCHGFFRDFELFFRFFDVFLLHFVHFFLRKRRLTNTFLKMLICGICQLRKHLSITLADFLWFFKFISWIIEFCFHFGLINSLVDGFGLNIKWRPPTSKQLSMTWKAVTRVWKYPLVSTLLGDADDVFRKRRFWVFQSGRFLFAWKSWLCEVFNALFGHVRDCSLRGSGGFA